MHIEREYNIYKIYATPTSKKPYIYNGDMRMAFLTNGKVMVRTSSLVNERVGNFIEFLMRSAHQQNNNAFEIVNRVISYPADNDIKEAIYRCIVKEDVSFYDEINTSWKIVLQMLKKEIPVQDLKKAIFRDLVCSYFKGSEELVDLACSAFHNYYYSSFQNKEAILKQKAFRAKVKENYKKREIAFSQIEEVAKNSVLMEMLFEGDDVETLKNRITRITINNIHQNVDKCIGILDLAQKLGIEDYKISNLDRDYENLKMRYEKEKTRIENENFKKHQTAINLEFENAEYKIYVPTSREELAEIGDYFNNCANRQEWACYLKNGTRYFVVVVEKATNRWRVCCDIDSVGKNIRQYLTINNSERIPENAKQFKEEYQEYLNII